MYPHGSFPFGSDVNDHPPLGQVTLQYWPYPVTAICAAALPGVSRPPMTDRNDCDTGGSAWTSGRLAYTAAYPRLALSFARSFKVELAVVRPHAVPVTRK